MSNFKKNHKLLSLTLLASLLLLAAVNVSTTVMAQGNATVNMTDTVGGTTDPASPGTYTYPDGTTVTFTATPAAGDPNTPGYVFQNWILVTAEGSSSVDTNPLSFPVTGGTTYDIQAVFAPVVLAPGGAAVPPNQLATAAIIEIFASAGGTTDPGPGIYALASVSALNLKATPDSGWQFDHWVISGPNLSHGGYPFTATPTDNPYNVNHGYGATYAYQAVFSPIGGGAGATPTPSSGGGGGGGTTVGASMIDTVIIIVLVVVVVILLIAFGVYASRKKK